MVSIRRSGKGGTSGGGTPSNSVTNETLFGQASIAGSATDYSRGDHTHGTPTNPVPAHEGTYDHSKIHDPATPGDGISVIGQQITNSDKGSTAVASAFSGLAKITVGITQPPTPGVGDLWVDTN